MIEAYNLKAKAKGKDGKDGSVTDFTLTVSEPSQMPSGEYACTIDCPLFSFVGKKFFGGTAGQAMALALWLVEDQLRHHRLTLIDDEGSPVMLPIDKGAGVPGHADPETR